MFSCLSSARQLVRVILTLVLYMYTVLTVLLLLTCNGKNEDVIHTIIRAYFIDFSLTKNLQ